MIKIPLMSANKVSCVCASTTETAEGAFSQIQEKCWISDVSFRLVLIEAGFFAGLHCNI